MGAQIRIYPEDAGDLVSLRDWLADIREVGVVPVPRETRPGEQGGIWGSLAVACGEGGAATVLVRALTTWIESRVTTLRVKTDDGTELVLKTSDAAELAPRLIELLRESAPDDDS
jgi:hypothetical protein